MQLLERIFLTVYNNSITATYVIIAVILIRLILKKSPRRYSLVLWIPVALRLIFPFSVKSIFSLIPSTKTVSPDIIYQTHPTINSGIDVVDTVVNPILSFFLYDRGGWGYFPPTPMHIISFILSIIWLCGISAIVIYSIVSIIILKHRVSTAVLSSDNIYQSERITSPFISGFFRVRIYLPFGLTPNENAHIIAHERSHIRHFDHLLKPFAFLLLCVYWLNPFIWIAYILFCRDIEAACDERVIKEMSSDGRKAYANTLLNFSTTTRTVTSPLAFGEVDVKQRIKDIMNYKKPVLLMSVISVFFVLFTTVCFATDPSAYISMPKLIEKQNYSFDIFDDIKEIHISAGSYNISLDMSDARAKSVIPMINGLQLRKDDQFNCYFFRHERYGTVNTLLDNNTFNYRSRNVIIDLSPVYSLCFDGRYSFAYVDYQLFDKISFILVSSDGTRTNFAFDKDFKYLYTDGFIAPFARYQIKNSKAISKWFSDNFTNSISMPTIYCFEADIKTEYYYKLYIALYPDTGIYHSSSLESGTYAFSGNKLILTSSENSNVYCFYINENTLVFDESSSSPVDKTMFFISDQDVFTLQ